MFFNLPYLAAFVPYNIVPISELYAWSDNQKIHILFHKIAELVKATNDYDKIFEELEGLLDDFDDEMKKQLEELLQKMYEDGSFNDMLSEIANDYFDKITAPKTFKIDTRREFRICRPVMPYNAKTTSGEWYSYCQGGKMFKRNNTLYYVCCLRISRTDNVYYNNDNADVRLYIYNKLDNKWEYYNHNVLSLGHANDICYCDKNDKFYVAYASQYPDGNTRKIAILDWNLNKEATIENTTIFHDEDVEFGPNHKTPISTVDYYDDKLWFSRGAGSANTTLRIDTVPVDDIMATATPYARFKMPVTTGTPYTMVMAGFCQNEDYIFIGNTAPAGIYRFNKTTMKIDCFYEIGNYSNNHMFPTGEMENLSCVDDIIYIGTAIHGNQQLFYYDYTQVFSFDFINNSRVPSGVSTSYGGFNRIINLGTQYYTIDGDGKKVWHYDERINAEKKEISNPNGFSGNYGEPFPTWEEAILFINAQDLWDTITIQQQTAYMVEYVCINSTKNIFIDGATAFKRRGGDDKNPLHYSRMGGIYIDGTNICIDHMWIQNLSPLNLTAYSTHQIFVRNSNAAIHSCIFYVTGRSGLGQIYDNNIININRGFLNTSYLRPVTYSGATHTDADFAIGNKYILSTTEGNGTSQSPYYLKYMTCYQSTINAFGDYVKGDTTGSFDKFFILS